MITDVGEMRVAAQCAVSLVSRPELTVTTTGPAAAGPGSLLARRRLRLSGACVAAMRGRLRRGRLIVGRPAWSP